MDRSWQNVHIQPLPDNPISRMSKSFKFTIPLLILFGLAWVSYMPVFFRDKDASDLELRKVSHPQTKAPPPALSALAPPPDWPSLEIYQNTITRSDFESFLTTIFTTGEAWRASIEISETEARIKTGESTNEIFTLRFSAETTASAPRHWLTATELPPTTADQPLAGLKIAIDPGHIGGEWAKMEERWMVVSGGSPVREGDMTLYVARLLKPKLEALGATVSLVRDKPEPVTSVRPDALMTLAKESSSPEATPDDIRRTAERFFYRTAEIRARADLVNEVLKPDLVLCLHFNAEAWGDPNKPTLIDRTHLHLLLNGAYNDDEVPLADQRFALLRKLLQRTHEEEIRAGSAVAAAFSEASGLPPYSYPPNSPNARAVPGEPYLWMRNLLANRIYDCPVIFMEPYVMNSTTDYARIQAGDYEGLREFGGKMQPSIFREYADSVAQGLRDYYTQSRRVEPAMSNPIQR
jgi:N-acetylmuramoyl-L-alanine amidase